MTDRVIAEDIAMGIKIVTQPFGGLPIIVSDHALKETTERLFPASRHRSKRLHKKLLKRFGGEFRKVPVIWKTPHSLIMHPALYAQMKEGTAKPWLPAFERRYVLTEQDLQGRL
jgi:hypothetical protein